MTHTDMMNSKEFVQITPDWDQPIVQGTLIGFVAFGDKVTAAYPVWRVFPEKKEIQFVLYFSSKDGSPCIDNTWFTSDKLVINKEPIVIELEVKNPISITDRVQQLFNGSK